MSAFFLRKVLSKFIAERLIRMIKGKDRNGKKRNFVNEVIPSLQTFLLAFICFAALDELHFPSQLNFDIAQITAKHIAHAGAYIILIITFIRLCIKVTTFVSLIIEERLGRDKADNQLIIFFRDFVKAILVIIGILLVIRFAFHKDIGNILAALSIAGAAFAFAAKESLENLIASFIIFFDKSFISGDTVKVGNTTGVVEKIGLRSTRIRTDQKTFVTVPNKQMVDTVVDNISLRNQRKVELRLELSLSTNASQLKKLSEDIRALLSEKTAIEKAIVYLMDTGKNAHVLAVDYFTGMNQSVDEFNLFREEVNLGIIELLNISHISLSAASTSISVTNK
jgi:MscS family membrane protein